MVTSGSASGSGNNNLEINSMINLVIIWTNSIDLD